MNKNQLIMIDIQNYQIHLMNILIVIITLDPNPNQQVKLNHLVNLKNQKVNLKNQQVNLKNQQVNLKNQKVNLKNLKVNHQVIQHLRKKVRKNIIRK